ncbi:kinase-like domain-containing protein [Crepidotus variabilis]|uniref:cAMP-dependent protein kinase n=1 Tax=Crepidotus variabilis TaxID=179855 RepID=A0A9P6JN58_9AGAR|nr:kinase-like domain-containing protein [Crepidotus variabilis]
MPANRSNPKETRKTARSLKTRPVRRGDPLLYEGEEIRYENVIFPAEDLGEPFKIVYALEFDDEYDTRAERVAQPHDPRPPRLDLKDLQIIKTLGQSICQVLLVRSKRKTHHLDSHHLFALKSIPRKHCRQIPVTLALQRALGEGFNYDTVERRAKEHGYEKKAEVGILAQLDWNPFVAGMYETFFDSVNLYVALEYAPGGTLRTLLRKSPGGMKPSESLFYFSNIVCALEFLHEHEIIHRDLKPENVLLNTDGYLCLTDFGSALRDGVIDRHWELGGTGCYQAPEWNRLMLCEDPCAKALDWWAAGCMLFEMATGKMASLSHLNHLLYAFFEGRNYLAWPPCAKIGKKLQDLILSILEVQPSDRIGTEGTEEVQSHPWLADVEWDNMRDRRYLPPYIPQPLDASGLWHHSSLPEGHQVPGLVLDDPPIHLANDDRFPERSHSQ